MPSPPPWSRAALAGLACSMRTFFAGRLTTGAYTGHTIGAWAVAVGEDLLAISSAALATQA
jgi:hypothetical protein